MKAASCIVLLYQLLRKHLCPSFVWTPSTLYHHTKDHRRVIRGLSFKEPFEPRVLKTNLDRNLYRMLPTDHLLYLEGNFASLEKTNLFRGKRSFIDLAQTLATFYYLSGGSL